MDFTIIQKLAAEPKYASQKNEYDIKFVPATAGSIQGEKDEILTKTVVIHFFPNSWDLDKKITRTGDGGKEVEELYDPNVGFIVEEVGKLAGQFGAARIVIEGHTDGSMKGQVPKSLVQELSMNRANAVKEAIVRKFGTLQPNQFSTAGAGWDRPADPSDPDNAREEPARRDQGLSGGGRPRQVDAGRFEDRALRPACRAAAPDAAAGRRGRARRHRGALVARDTRSGAEERLISPVILPSPAEVVRSFPSLVRDRALVASIAATLQRVLVGFGLAILVGVPLGIVAGAWRLVEAAGAPLALFGRNMPVAALIPLTILWFGIDETQKVMFIFIATVPFVFSDAATAIANVPDRYVETAQTLGASSMQIVSKVLVALALPDIYKSLRHLFGLAFGYIMLAELINAQHGLGFLLMTSQRRGLSEHIILILIVIGLLAYGIDRLLAWFQRGLFPYRAVED